MREQKRTSEELVEVIAEGLEAAANEGSSSQVPDRGTYERRLGAARQAVEELRAAAGAVCANCFQRPATRAGHCEQCAEGLDRLELDHP